MRIQKIIGAIGLGVLLSGCGHNIDDKKKAAEEEKANESFWCSFYGNCEEGHGGDVCDLYGTCEEKVDKMCSFYGNCENKGVPSVSSGCEFYDNCGGSGGGGIHGSDTPDSSPGDIGY